MPGVKESDLDITINHDNLIIRGHREHKYDVENSTTHRVECTYGTVQRSIHLPPNADQSQVTANFDNGVLTVTLAKKAPVSSSPGTKIPVNVSK